MTDPTARFVDGSLSPEEARKLAQESLDDPKLFGELTEAALVKAALNRETVRAPRVIGIDVRVALVMVAAAVAAGIVMMFVAVNRFRPVPPPIPTLTASATHPVLLAHGLEPGAVAVFRGDTTDTRAPQESGRVISVEDGLANINLGSLDGLSKGSELAVFRGPTAIGRIQVTTVFRDHARSQPVDGTRVHEKDEVKVSPTDRLAALSQQAAAQFHRGDTEGAIRSFDQAVQDAESAGVPAGTLASTWNQLATLRLLHRDYDAAEALIAKARASVTDNTVRAEILNNLAVMAEMSGDRKTALSHYADALKIASNDDRRTLESNLARLRGVH